MSLPQPTTSTTPWWQPGVIYQIYPRSFQDSGRAAKGIEGVGDLAGILSRLDYLVTLGVDAIWISPFYPSPMADFGYDVADYTDVDPMFGTLADFDTLLAAAHAHKLKVVLDFVPNHSSNQHPWFLESRASRTSPKRDWYIWHDPAAGDGAPELRPPNNWTSQFGGSAWEFDAGTGQFYLHSFLKEQPDLNWRNPEVKRAIYTAMMFWLDKGVDGFRMDVLWLLIKDANLRDNPPNPDWHPGQSSNWQFMPVYTSDQPDTHVIVAEMRHLLDTYKPERLLIGEIYLPIRDLVRYYGASVPEAGSTPVDSEKADAREVKATTPPVPVLNGANLPFNFHLIQTAWQAPAIAGLIRDYEAALPLGAWPNWVLGNHDQSRLATRIGPAQARVAAMLLLTLRGTPTLYYGDELGMTDGRIPPDRIQDPAEKNQPGIGMGRDPERTPMLWDNAPNAGFTAPDATPWLPIASDFAAHTVATEDPDPNSMLNLYRTLLKLRRSHPALHSGTVSGVEALNDAVLTYTRTDVEERGELRVLLNLTGTSQHVEMGGGMMLLSTDASRTPTGVSGGLTLAPDEGLLCRVD